MPVTLESNRILIDTVEVETVKTHVPEVDIDIDIVPAITYPDTTTRNLQLAAETATGVNGWRIVRFKPNGNWYSYNDNAMGTHVNHGTSYDYTNQWTVLFGDFDELLFSTYNMQHWLRATKAELQISGYSNTSRTVLSSSRTFTQHTVKWYNRTGVNEDPFVSLYDHLDYASQGQSHMYCLYSDGNSIHHKQLLQDSSLGGMCVFVRTSTDTISSSIIPAMPVYEDTTHQLQNLAEQKTGVKGWRLVRFLPSTSTTWYSVDDNSFGTATPYGTAYDYTNEWSIDYGGSFDEMFFATKNMNYWVYCPKSSVEGIYSNAGRAVYKTSSNTNPHNVNWYNRTNNNQDPLITDIDYGSSGVQFVYIENSYEGSQIRDGGMCVFVRTSTDTVTVNPEPVYKTLAFTYNNDGTNDYDSGTWVNWAKTNSVSNVSSKNWFLKATKPAGQWFVDGLLNDTPSNKHLIFIRKLANGTIQWTMILKSDISANHNWSSLSRTSDYGTFSTIYRYNDQQATGTHAPIITETGNVQNNSVFIYREEYQATWHSGTPTGNEYYVLEEQDEENQQQTEYTVNFPEDTECDILIVGGGGGGGVYNGGGGGGGGVIYATNLSLNGEYIVKVGKGGDVAATNTQSLLSENGFSSIFGKSGDLLEVFGGGRGGNAYGAIVTTNKNGADGGSGGGGSNNNGIGGYPIQPIYSTEITSANSSYYGGTGGTHGGDTNGGGGGAGNITPNRKNGADGIQINIDGNNYYWGGGGGGADWNNLGGSGGKGGGGGAGGTSGNGGSGGTGGISVGSDGTGSGGANAQTGVGGDGGSGTGGGGGANAAFNGSVASGNGGSGIVIIRYKTKYIRQHPAYDAQWTYHSTNPNVHHYGNVGIGTLASETNKLTVKGDMNMIGNYKQNDVNLGNWYSSDNIHNIHRLTGNVGIGTTDPQYSIDTTGVLYASHGGFTGGTSTNWATSSDERIKDNITSASNETCYENVKNINLYKFNYKEQFANNKNETQYGFIAQEVQKYYPKAVKYEKIKVKDDTYENFLTINQTQLNYTLFGAVKHLQLELENIKVKLGMVEPIQEEPVAEETNTTEEPAVEETNTTEEPVAEETNTTEEPAVEETNTTEEPVTEETNTTEEPVAEETNTTEEPVAEETNTTEEPVAEETNTN